MKLEKKVVRKLYSVRLRPDQIEAVETTLANYKKDGYNVSAQSILENVIDEWMNRRGLTKGSKK